MTDGGIDGSGSGRAPSKEDSGPARRRGGRQPLGLVMRSDRHFRWRCTEVTRIEGFSDAAFAFALTLLVVSLEVPESFDSLLATMRGFVPFAASFAILVWIWYEHYLFFQRFGIADVPVVWLNSMLLFVVLFYVYPMKFTYNAMLGGSGGFGLTLEQVPVHYTIFGAGFFAVFGLLLALYGYAWRHRHVLELDEVERAVTRGTMGALTINLAVATTSITIGWLVPAQPALGGMTYFLLGPAHGWWGYRVGKRVEALAAERDG